MSPSAAFTHFWQGWALSFLISFLVAEIWALTTNWRNSLSANVWRALHAHAGEPITQWTALHYLSAGLYLVLASWLFWHFFFVRFRA